MAEARPVRLLLFAGLLLAAACARLIVASPQGDARDLPAVRVITPSGTMPAVLAATPDQRALGYRHIDRAVAPPAIWFRYPSPRAVTFHMRDVSFSVRAYWLDEAGCVAGWTDMAPGDEGHDSPVAVTAVLEIPGDRLAATELTVGDCLRLDNPSPPG